MKDLNRLADLIDGIALPGMEKAIVRNFITDFNQQGLAKHEVQQVLCRKSATDQEVIESVKKHYQERKAVLVSAVEVRGKRTIEELQEIMKAPECAAGQMLKRVYLDKQEAMKTMWQEFLRK